MFTFKSNQSGFSLAEVMLAMAMAGGVAVLMTQISKTGNEGIKRVEAKSDRLSVQNQVQSALGHPTGCFETLDTIVTSANHVNNALPATTGTAVTQIRNHLNNVTMTSTTKVGDVTLTSITYSRYNSSTQQALLTIKGSFKVGKVTQKMKDILIPINVSLDASNNLTNCAAASSSDVSEIWQLMTGGAFGIYYNGGSVLVGSGAVDTGSSNAAFAAGSNNTVQANSAAALGYNNTLNSGAVYSVAAGGSNTISSTYSFIGGHANTVNITTGSVGASGPIASIALGRSNNVTGSEAVALGYGNTVQNRFSVAIGAVNNISGSGSVAIGTWNVVTGTNANVMGQYAEGNGQNSQAIGNYVKSNGTGSMTLGDNSTGTYLVNATNHAFMARFDGGYTWYSDSALGSFDTMVWKDGFLGIGTTTPSIATNKLEVVGGTTTLEQEAQVAPALANNWKSYPGLDVKYYKDSTGRVWLSGGICNWNSAGATCTTPAATDRHTSVGASRWELNAATSTFTSYATSNNNPNAFTLPVGYRPTSAVAHIYKCVHRFGTHPSPDQCTVFIWSSGVVSVYSTHTERIPMLDGISFKP